jgi:hypothetical protein
MKTNSIPERIPCPKCTKKALITALEYVCDQAAIAEITATCECGEKLRAVGVGKDGCSEAAVNVAIDDLRSVYRAKLQTRKLAQQV